MDKMKELFKALNEKPIAYHRVYTRITNQLVAGVLLSQLVYWGGTRDYKEFYKTDKEIGDETGLAMWEVRKGKKLLAKLGLVTITLKSLPRKTYYTVEIDKICNEITSLSDSDIPVCAIDSNKNKPITHTTSENTPKITYREKNNTQCKHSASFSSDTEDIIHKYYEYYENYTGRKHPDLKQEQYEKVAGIIEMADIEDYSCEAYFEAYFEEFAGKGTTDFNINHFAGQKMIEILGYRSM